LREILHNILCIKRKAQTFPPREVGVPLKSALYYMIKSTDVYKIIRKYFAPWARNEKFKRTKSGMLGYYKPYKHKYFVFWFQCDRYGELFPGEGSGFTIEFLYADEPFPGIRKGAVVNNRFSTFTSVIEIKEIIEKQNIVIDKSDNNRINTIDYYRAKNIVYFPSHDYRMEFQNYKPGYDIWLRYIDENDVNMWADYLHSIFPDMIKKVFVKIDNLLEDTTKI